MFHTTLGTHIKIYMLFIGNLNLTSHSVFLFAKSKTLKACGAPPGTVD